MFTMNYKQRRSAKRKAKAIAAEEAGCSTSDLLKWHDAILDNERLFFNVSCSDLFFFFRILCTDWTVRDALMLSRGYWGKWMVSLPMVTLRPKKLTMEASSRRSSMVTITFPNALRSFSAFHSCPPIELILKMTRSSQRLNSPSSIRIFPLCGVRNAEEVFQNMKDFRKACVEAHKIASRMPPSPSISLPMHVMIPSQGSAN